MVEGLLGGDAKQLLLEPLYLKSTFVCCAVLWLDMP